MKKLFSIAVLLTLVVSAFAQKPKSKDDLFKQIGALVNTKKPEDAEKAYPLAKEFLSRFGADNDPKVKSIKAFADSFREHSLYVDLESKKYADGFRIGREILTEQPTNVDVLMNLAYAGYTAVTARDNSYVDEGLYYAKKVLELLDAGTVPKSFDPFKDKTEASAFMYFVVGNLQLDKDKKEAATNLYKATQFESQIKTNSVPYFLIASFYEGEYEKLAADLRVKADAKKTGDPEFKAESAKADKTVELMMDAYARAVKRGSVDKNPNVEIWKQRLTQVYTFVKKSDKGLSEYIDQTDATPMPDPGKY